jgi:hypothetical protein
MKLLLLAALLSSFAPAVSPALPVSPPDYSGSWTLDKARSPDLPPMYANVREQRLTVVQDDARLVVDVEMDTGAAEPERFNSVYSLQGEETSTTMWIRTPDGRIEAPARLRARLGDDGRLHITITRELVMRGETVHATGTEAWALSADGRTLTVHRHEQLRGREMRFNMVFTRS